MCFHSYRGMAPPPPKTRILSINHTKNVVKTQDKTNKLNIEGTIIEGVILL
jgi:hypothetical protein